MPHSIAAVLGSGKATLRELDEYYSIQDMYKILEVLQVDAHNERIISKAKA